MNYYGKLITLFLLLAVIASHSNISIHPTDTTSNSVHIYAIDSTEEFIN